MFKVIAKRALGRREDKVWSVYEMWGARKVQRVNWLHARSYRDWDHQSDPMQGYLLLTTENLVFNLSDIKDNPSPVHIAVPLKSVTNVALPPDLAELLIQFTDENDSASWARFDLNVVGQKSQLGRALKEQFAMDLQEQVTLQAQEYGREPMPLHALLGEDGDSDFDDPIEAVVEADAVPFTLLQEQLRSVLDTLSEREAGVVSMRFGLTDGQPKTRGEIGKTYGLADEQIRQIESEMMSKLHHRVRHDGLSED